MTNDSTLEKSALRFVLIIGMTNLFADMTYEGARGISGPFLGSLGASAAVVGVVAGAGELLGYGLRSVSGYLSDKTRKYWFVVFAGYFINMLAVPALALAGNWPAGAVLLIAERTGRAIRKPSVEAMISYAGKSIGRGWVFGLNEALDQTGATIGPLIAALILYSHGSYRRAFGVLLIPAILCLATLTLAQIAYPRPTELEDGTAQFLQMEGFSKAYWIYLAAGTFIACGFTDFSLIAFHFQKAAVLSQKVIPLFYAAAMAMGAITSVLIGKLLDRIGLPAVLLAFSLPAFSAPLVFLGGAPLAFIGMMLWGIGMGAQDSSLKAVLAGVISPEKRSTGFGLFDTGFGIAWFLGSATMGLLYDRSIPALVVFSTVIQLTALPLLFYAKRQE